MFDRANYEDQEFKELVIEDETIEDIDFEDCTFSKCAFTGTSFKACTFKDCSFTDCDLSLVKVDNSVFKSVSFENSKVIGINWALASWGTRDLQHLLNSISFSECVLNYSSFVGVELESLKIEKCTAREVDFSEASLVKGNFQDTDLTESHFRNTNLSEANFVGAKNYTIDPGVNTIKKARFSIPEAMALLYSMDIEIVD